MREKILIVDDDASFRRVVDYTLKEEGYETLLAENGIEALEKLHGFDCSVLITDVRMPHMNGLELLKKTQTDTPELPVIVVTAHAAVEDAVEAMRQGAFDYVVKPVNRDQLKFVVRKALEVRELKRENNQLRQAVSERLHFENIIGRSERMQRVFQMTAQAARVDSTVLIRGGSGTGKELLAKAIHYNSSRKSQPFVVVNCAAIPDSLLESELFGHTRGSFTGAVADRKGKVEMAIGGTIFLDEVGDLQPQTQVKLLRLLQEKEIDKIGVPRPLKVDVRIIAATHRDLETLVREVTFREDRYYRFNVIPIEIPPLCERREDIPLLADFFLKKYTRIFGKELKLHSEVLRIFDVYPWPGNIRELENLMERLAALNDGGTITIADLPEFVLNQASRAHRVLLNIPPEGVDLEGVERDLIRAALERNDWNQTHAARFLRISRNTLIYRMQKFGISLPEGAGSQPSAELKEGVNEASI
jgi:two-component system NtrC family response regulator